MYSLVYEPGIPGVKPIDLSGEDYTVGQATGLRSTAWTYTLATAGLSGVSASARETTLTVSARTPELFDRPGMIFDAEMSLGKPGTLVIDGQWRQRCYVTKTSTTAATRMMDSPSTQSWTVVLLDGAWTRLLPVEHFNPVTSTATGLDLPTDLPLDLAAGGYTRYIQNDSLAPVDWRMTVFGPATDPHVTIGSNIVELTGSIPDGCYATIDSRTRRITLTRADGSTQNVFSWGVRSTGVGSGHYVFERIPAGQQVVSWPSSFSFDMQLLEERTDPTWGGIRITPVDAIHPDPITVGYGAGIDALARTTTVKWSDGHTSVEPITWEPLTGTNVPGATIIAKGTAQGQYLTQQVMVQPDLLDVSEMGQSAFENGPDYDSRWSQKADGGWSYDNPSDSGISEYAGRSFGGHMGGTHPDVNTRVRIPAGDYTLVIPVMQADGFPVSPAPHSIYLSYRLSSDGEKWNASDYYRAEWKTPPASGSELRMKVHAEQPGYFGFSLSFDAIPGMTFGVGKPMLLSGILPDAAVGGSLLPDLTGIAFQAKTLLPDGWDCGDATPRTPDGQPWSYELAGGGWMTSPDAGCRRGDTIRFAITYMRRSENDVLVFGVNVNYPDGTAEPMGMMINPVNIAVGQVTGQSVDITTGRDGEAHLLIWTDMSSSPAGATASILSLTAERITSGGAVNH